MLLRNPKNVRIFKESSCVNYARCCMGPVLDDRHGSQRWAKEPDRVMARTHARRRAECHESWPPCVQVDVRGARDQTKVT